MQQVMLVTEEQLRQIVAETIKTEIQAGLMTFAPVANQSEPDELMTRKDAAKVLGVSLPTLHKWTVEHTVKGFHVGTRVRYWRKDVELALKEISTHRKSA